LDFIEDDSRNSFNECAKIYRNRGGFYEVSDFCPPEIKNSYFGMNMMNNMNMGMMNNMNMNMNMNNMNMGMRNMNNMNRMDMSAPLNMNMMNMSQMQMMNNMNFSNNAIRSVSNVLNKK